MSSPTDAAGQGFVVLANPAAGSADDDLTDQITDRLGQYGTVVLSPIGDDPDDDTALDRAITEADGRCLVVVGGDGSLHRTVARMTALDRLDLEVGLVPLGTGNDLARGATLTLDPLAAASAIGRLKARPMDLLIGNDSVIVNAVHLGLGADAAIAASRWKSRLGAAAYPLGAVVAGTWSTPWELKVTVDGRVLHDGMTVLAGIGNGPSIGGGTRMFPGARLDDGQAVVVVAGNRWGRAGRAVFGRSLRHGQHGRLPWVRVARGRHIEVTGEPVAGNADGEIWSASPSWEVTVNPAALRLRRP
ncbi:MAG TPA: diacylglycerol kinase family protein [Kineosporiaceae bacterium]|nr:diacylglycerol kinase family protein [Kineosporiaceae bacterium]